MNRCTFLVSFLFLSGCGSCLEDKKVPEVDQGEPTVKTLLRNDETGAKKRPVIVGGGLHISDALKLDSGADAHP